MCSVLWFLGTISGLTIWLVCPHQYWTFSSVDWLKWRLLLEPKLFHNRSLHHTTSENMQLLDCRKKERRYYLNQTNKQTKLDQDLPKLWHLRTFQSGHNHSTLFLGHSKAESCRQLSLSQILRCDQKKYIYIIFSGYTDTSGIVVVVVIRRVFQFLLLWCLEREIFISILKFPSVRNSIKVWRP